MIGRRWVLCAMVAMLLTLKGAFGATYVDAPFNKLIEQSEAIMVGEVASSTLEAESNGDVYRMTVVRSITVVKGHVEPGEVITVRTFEGVGAGDGFTYLSPFLVEFKEGEQVFLLLRTGMNGGSYEIAGLFRGKLDVVDGAILGTGMSLDAFLLRIEDVLHGGQLLQASEIPTVESQLPKKAGHAKILTTGSHLSGQFDAADSYNNYSPPLSVTFEINPNGAIDGDGNKVSFASLKAAAEACAGEWNSLLDGYVNFTIAADSSSRGPHDVNDAYSTITFEDFPDSYAGYGYPARPVGGTVTSDIWLNTDFRWSPTETYPGSWGTKPMDFRDVVTHEMGHSVGLNHCDTADTNNTMYYSSYVGETKKRSLEWGDEAGGVYMSTKPGRSGDGIIDFDQVWSAFAGSSKKVQLQQNIQVPSGRSLYIDVNSQIDWNGHTISSTGGLIEAHDDGALAVTPDTVEARKGGVRISFYNTSGLGNSRLSNVIKYGTTSGSYTGYKVISPTTEGRNNVEVTGLTNGTRYYFKLGEGSERSNTPHSCRSDYDGDGGNIDFDDFFLWVDHIGSVTSDALQRYDLSGNAVIDSSSDYIPFFYPDFGHSCASIPKAILAGEGPGGKNSGATVRLAAYAGKAEIEVDVETSGAQSIKGYGLVIAYDPAILTYQGLAEGAAGLMARPGGTIDIEKEVNGRLLVGAMLKPGEPVTTGDRLLTRLVFRPVGSVPEQPPVTLMEAYLADEQTRVDRIGAQTTSSETRITALDLSASPNPMNPTVAISFGLPESGVCDLRVYDLLGQQVKTLVDGEFRFAGSHQVMWEGMDNSGHPVASGTYLVQLRFRGQIQTQRLTVLR